MECLLHLLIDEAIAIVIDPIAALGRRRANVGDPIVAIRTAPQAAICLGVAACLGSEGVSILIGSQGPEIAILIMPRGVAYLDVAGIPIGIRVIAIRSTAGFGIDAISVSVSPQIANGLASRRGLVAGLPWHAGILDGGSAAPRVRPGRGRVAALDTVAEDPVVAIEGGYARANGGVAPQGVHGRVHGRVPGVARIDRRRIAATATTT